MGTEQKYILINADYNDGDYTTKISKITDEEIEFIKPIIEAIKKNNGSYWTRDMASKGESAEEDYGHLKCFEFFDELVPSGDDSYSGVHTIESIEIIKKIEILL